jgi:Na+/H+ antiporter NhaD/arsenite permease-like protein
MSIMSQIVNSHHQRVIYACAIMISASLGGAFTVIGDMTSLMLWVRGVVTPSGIASGLFLPSIVSLCVFIALLSKLLVGKVETSSVIGRYNGDDSLLPMWQKVLLLIIGLVGLWAIPTFHYHTSLPPFLGALCVLALVWVVEGFCNFERNGNMLFVQRKHLRSSEFISMRIILYFIGISLGAGVLKECGVLDFVGSWLNDNVNNTYVYGVFTGLISSVIDNVPFVLMGMNLFPVDMSVGNTSDFVVDGAYWQMLSYCCAIGGSLLFAGSLSGQAVMQVEKIRFVWYCRHIIWRVIVSWIVGMIVFWLIH